MKPGPVGQSAHNYLLRDCFSRPPQTLGHERGELGPAASTPTSSRGHPNSAMTMHSRASKPLLAELSSSCANTPCWWPADLVLLSRCSSDQLPPPFTPSCGVAAIITMSCHTTPHHLHLRRRATTTDRPDTALRLKSKSKKKYTATSSVVGEVLQGPG